MTASNDVADKAAIVDLITTYARAIDTRDWDLYESVFVADAVVDYTSSGGVRGTPQEARKWVSEALKPFTMTQHLVTNHQVVIAGDTAKCHSDYYNPMGSPDGKGGLKLFFVGGSYSDEFRRTTAGWLFTERVEEMLWVSGAVPRIPGVSI